MTNPIATAGEAVELLGEALFGLSTRLNIEFLADDENHTAYEKVVVAFRVLTEVLPNARTITTACDQIERYIADYYAAKYPSDEWVPNLTNMIQCRISDIRGALGAAVDPLVEAQDARKLITESDLYGEPAVEVAADKRHPRAVAVVSQMDLAEQIDFARRWIETICSAHIWQDSSGGEFHGKIVGDILSFGLDAALSRHDDLRSVVERCHDWFSRHADWAPVHNSSTQMAELCDRELGDRVSPEGNLRAQLKNAGVAVVTECYRKLKMLSDEQGPDYRKEAHMLGVAAGYLLETREDIVARALGSAVDK